MIDSTVSLPEFADLDEHDQIELVAFSSKVEHEGLGYTLWQYCPSFHNVTLQAIVDEVSTGYGLLNDWLERHDDRVGEFWETEGADNRYNDHLRAQEEARRQARELAAE